MNSSFQVPAIFECEEDTDAPCDKVSEDNNDKDKEILERQNREDAIFAKILADDALRPMEERIFLH